MPDVWASPIQPVTKYDSDMSKNNSFIADHRSTGFRINSIK
jgi:hypothetical protein